MGGIAIYLGFTSSMVALTPPWEPLGWIMAGGLPLVSVGMPGPAAKDSNAEPVE